jgi:F0F1-type ATP synthase membrane subunit a
MRKGGDNFLKTFTMFLIELVREFSRPIALTVRLTVNILVGHIIRIVLYSCLELFLGNVFFFLVLFAILMECFVFFIQRYIFSRLIYLYLNE